jgi:predicted transcriptional regulator
MLGAAHKTRPFPSQARHCIGLTLRVTVAILTNMEVRLKPELQARVDRAAKENNSGPAEYVQRLVEHYVDHDVWFREQVKKGLDQLDRGEFLTHEEMGTRIEQMFRS